MLVKLKWMLLSVGVAIVVTSQGSGQQPDRTANQSVTMESLRAEVDSLKSSNVAWRKIAWKSCLLDGLKEARAKGKPALLWVFIDRPTDDARC